MISSFLVAREKTALQALRTEVRGVVQPRKFPCRSAQVAPASWAWVEADSLRSPMQPPPSGALGRHPRTRPPCTTPTRPLASGSVDLYRLYTTPPEDYSSRTLRVRRALRVVLQHPFSGGRRALRGVRRARTYLWLANHRARVSPQAPSGKGDERAATRLHSWDATKAPSGNRCLCI